MRAAIDRRPIRFASARTKPCWATAQVTCGTPARLTPARRMEFVMAAMHCGRGSGAGGRSASGTKRARHHPGVARTGGRWASWMNPTGSATGSAMEKRSRTKPKISIKRTPPHSSERRTMSRNPSRVRVSTLRQPDTTKHSSTVNVLAICVSIQAGPTMKSAFSIRATTSPGTCSRAITASGSRWATAGTTRSP